MTRPSDNTVRVLASNPEVALHPHDRIRDLAIEVRDLRDALRVILSTTQHGRDAARCQRVVNTIARLWVGPANCDADDMVVILRVYEAAAIPLRANGEVIS